MRDLILGTAGHIDHGKTSLVAALTGTDTDRLPEEKKRGITIELGYAQLELPPYRLGIVDVPGHEKFVRQMLAGATGMDLVLLVVAGDDSVKQQTTEHLDILRLLDLPAGVIALTKCDVCDPDWLELVEEEVRTVVAGTFLEQAPIVRTSAKTGLGLDTLKQELKLASDRIAETDRESRLQAPFRMAIDRCFSIEGHGTVVTGSVNSGRLETGQTLALQPGDVSVRVRGIQNHDQQSDTVGRGQRAAINLTGVHRDQLERGHELCSPGHLQPSELLTVRLQLLERIDKPLKDRARVRLHLGTAEIMANLRLLDRKELQPGETCFAQAFLQTPAVSVWHQPFVIRRESPVETIGGGMVLCPVADRIRKATAQDLEMLSQLDQTDDDIRRAGASLYFCGDLGWTPGRLSRDAGLIDVQAVYQRLKEEGELLEIATSQSRHVTIHRLRLEQMADRVLKKLEQMHRDQPLRFTHPRTTVESEFAYLDNPSLLDFTINYLVKENKVVANVNSVGLVGYGPKLSKGQKALLAELVQTMESAGIETPTVAQLVKEAKKNKDSVPELLEMASENGDLVKVSDDYYLHRQTFEDLIERLAGEFAAAPEMTTSEIRQHLGTSRKYAIPILEFLDRQRITVRDGDVRRWGKAS